MHRPELQHCSNFMWKYKEHQGLRALSHQILGHGLQGSFSFRTTYCLVYRQLAAEWSLHLPPFLLPAVVSRLPQRLLIRAWLGTSVPLHTLLWGNLAWFLQLYSYCSFYWPRVLGAGGVWARDTGKWGRTDEIIDGGVNCHWRLLHMVLCVWRHVLSVPEKASWLKTI